MQAEGETDVVEQDACRDNDAGLVEEQIGRASQGFRGEEVDRRRRVRLGAFRVSAVTLLTPGFLLGVHAMPEIQQLLHDAEERGDESRDRPAQHHQFLAVFFKHR